MIVMYTCLGRVIGIAGTRFGVSSTDAHIIMREQLSTL